MFVKICGITRVGDAVHAAREGATALGFVLWPESPRAVSREQVREIVSAVPSTIVTVGVFVNEPVEAIRETVAATGLTAVQLQGEEPPAYARTLEYPVFRGFGLNDGDQVCATWPEEATLLVDTNDRVRRGGTGRTVDWVRAAVLARRRRLVLAGGLTPENVASAIVTVEPYGVDVASGVEDSPGIKNLDKVSRFIENARRAFKQG